MVKKEPNKNETGPYQNIFMASLFRALSFLILSVSGARPEVWTYAAEPGCVLGEGRFPNGPS